MDFDDVMCEVKWAINHLCRMPREFILACKGRRHDKEIAKAIVKFFVSQSHRDYLHWKRECYKADKKLEVKILEDVWLEVYSEDCYSTVVRAFDEDDYEYYLKVLPPVEDLDLSDWSRRWYVRKCTRNICKILNAQHWICE